MVCFSIILALFIALLFFQKIIFGIFGLLFLGIGNYLLFTSQEYKILRNRKKIRDLNEIYQERFSNGTFLSEMKDAKIISRQIDVLKKEQKRLLETQE